MSDQTVNGKHTKVGHKVTYTSVNGEKHDAVIKKLEGNHADLEAIVNGAPQQFAKVPHSVSGTSHTWDHTS